MINFDELLKMRSHAGVDACCGFLLLFETERSVLFVALDGAQWFAC